MTPQPLPLWPLPAAIAAVLAFAAHLAWWLATRDGLVPACIPYLDGCTSISRAARHGLANPVFRLLVLPCALLVALHWWTSARWLRAHGAAGRAVLVAGLVAGLALAVYAAFLGTEGGAYRLLRRNGVIVFFGAGFLAQLWFVRGAARLGLLDRGSRLALPGVAGAMLAVGFVHVAALAWIGGSEVQDRLENALEWHLGLLLVAWYLLHARLWRVAGVRVSLPSPGG